MSSWGTCGLPGVSESPRAPHLSVSGHWQHHDDCRAAVALPHRQASWVQAESPGPSSGSYASWWIAGVAQYQNHHDDSCIVPHSSSLQLELSLASHTLMPDSLRLGFITMKIDLQNSESRTRRASRAMQRVDLESLGESLRKQCDEERDAWPSQPQPCRV